MYNINRIFYDQRSLQNPAASWLHRSRHRALQPGYAGCRYPDVGNAVQGSTAARTGRAIVRSPGNGYHVNIVAYGGTGKAFEGAVEGIDFRRRSAENLLGGFLSLDDP